MWNQFQSTRHAFHLPVHVSWTNTQVHMGRVSSTQTPSNLLSWNLPMKLCFRQSLWHNDIWQNENYKSSHHGSYLTSTHFLCHSVILQCQCLVSLSSNRLPDGFPSLKVPCYYTCCYWLEHMYWGCLLKLFFLQRAAYLCHCKGISVTIVKDRNLCFKTGLTSSRTNSTPSTNRCGP